jgi:hypothetical protein
MARSLLGVRALSSPQMGGNYVYYSGGGNDFGTYGMLASILKVNTNSAVIFVPIAMAISGSSFDPNSMIGAGFDLSMKISHPESGELVTVGEAIAEPSKNWTQITEEEFYKIPTMVAIDFSGETKYYAYEEGMTWGEWVNSEYSKGEFQFLDYGDFQKIRHIDYYGEVMEDSDAGNIAVKDSDLISYNKKYKYIMID